MILEQTQKNDELVLSQRRKHIRIVVVMSRVAGQSFKISKSSTAFATLMYDLNRDETAPTYSHIQKAEYTLARSRFA